MDKKLNVIKGPITLGGKSKTLNELIASGKVKLPFSAEGWKSEENSTLVNSEVKAIPEVEAKISEALKFEEPSRGYKKRMR